MMPHVMDVAASGPRSDAPRAWSDRVSGWLRAATGTLPPCDDANAAIDRFADILAHARDLSEVRVTLVHLAGRASGAARVELYRHGKGTDAAPGPLARWPRASGPDPVGDALSDAGTLRIDLRSAGQVLATLRLTPAPDRPWTPASVRALETLCAMAAGAERGLASPADGAALARAGEIPARPMPETTADLILRFALAQADRRHEPLSLLDITVDRIDAIRSVFGGELAEAAVERVARVVQGTIRASDLVAPIDGGGVLAVLPTASAANAARVAETIREAVAHAGRATLTMPLLTTTVGVATYPDHAPDVFGLRAAAILARELAASGGPDRIHALPPDVPIAEPGPAARPRLDALGVSP